MLIELDFELYVKVTLNGFYKLTEPISLKGKKLSLSDSDMHSATYMNSTFVTIVMKSIDRKQVIPSPF